MLSPHCPLRVIDEHGKDIPRLQEAWSEWSYFPRSSGRLRDRPHVRLAPFDGLLHLGGETVYRSITQLLIRRSLFESIRMFGSTWGSVGDFDWEMRAGLVANTVHVPHTWGGWRIHASQATAFASFGSEEHRQKIDSMIDHTVAACRSKLESPVARHLGSWVARAKDLRQFNRGLVRHLDDAIARRRFIVAQLVTGSAAARAHVLCKLSGRVPQSFTSASETGWKMPASEPCWCRRLRWLRKTRSLGAPAMWSGANAVREPRFQKFSDMPSILYLAPCSPGKTFGQASRVAQIVSGLKAIGKVDLVVVKAAEWLLEVPPGCGVIDFNAIRTVPCGGASVARSMPGSWVRRDCRDRIGPSVNHGYASAVRSRLDSLAASCRRLTAMAMAPLGDGHR